MGNTLQYHALFLSSPETYRLDALHLRAEVLQQLPFEVTQSGN